MRMAKAIPERSIPETSRIEKLNESFKKNFSEVVLG
jgi:hypothetical protein